jgi:hypothetical protein
MAVFCGRCKKCAKARETPENEKVNPSYVVGGNYRGLWRVVAKQKDGREKCVLRISDSKTRKCDAL